MSRNRRAIGILQPVYLPWLGYFEQMALVDHFVFLDDVQYTHQDWRNRNRVKTSAGSTWLTVPVRRAPLLTTIGTIEINEETDWRKRHLRTLEQAYGKCRHFRPLFDDLESALQERAGSLADLDIRLTEVLCRHLHITTPTSRASSVEKTTDDSTGRLLELCRAQGANVFYEGARGKNYLDPARFEASGVSLVFQDYRHPIYPQRYGEFLSHQSAVDLIMNTGPEAPALLRSSPVPDAFASRDTAGPATPA